MAKDDDEFLIRTLAIIAMVYLIYDGFANDCLHTLFYFFKHGYSDHNPYACLPFMVVLVFLSIGVLFGLVVSVRNYFKSFSENVSLKKKHSI
jgi:hypothetical protein